MGWFYDECPVCHNKVSKKARFCSKCGHGAPKGWVTCPSCRKWIGNDSRYCPHCNHPLHPEERVDFAGGVWDREPGLFAQRFELSDVTGIMKGGLKIQEGTLAILLDAGKKVAVLGPGRHTPEGTLRSINWFGHPPPRSVVMVDSGDCVFRMDIKGMRTAEELPVDVVAEVTLRFDPGNADGFLENMFKDSRLEAVEARVRVKAEEGGIEAAGNLKVFELRGLRSDAIGMWLVEEASAAVKDVCQQSTVEDLVKDPERRPRFEDAISRELKDLLKRSGLELVRVGYVDFISKDYEDMRQKYADLDVKRRQLEFDRKVFEQVKSLNELELADKTEEREKAYRENVVDADYDKKEGDLEEQKKRDEARRVRDTEEYLAQLAQEKGLSEISHDAEIEIAKLAALGKVDAREAEERLAKLSREHKIAFAELEHKLDTARRLRADELDEAKHGAAVGDIGRSEKIKDAESDAAVARGKIDTKNYEAKTAQELAQAAAKANLDNLERMAKIDAEERRTLAAAVKGMSAEEMAAVLDDPGRRADLLEIAKARIEVEKAKVQAEADVAIAKATSDTSQKDRLIEEMKGMMSDRTAHDEKLVAMLHDIATKAVEKPVTVVNGATAQPAPINIVK